MAERGSSMVEMVIVLMLALTVLFGITEFGRALFVYHAIANDARLATRYAIVHGSNCIPGGCTASNGGIQQYVRSVSVGLDQNKVTSTATWSGTGLDGSACSEGSEAAGCIVSVTVSYPFDFILSLPGLSSVTMSSSSQMVVAN